MKYSSGTKSPGSVKNDLMNRSMTTLFKKGGKMMYKKGGKMMCKKGGKVGTYIRPQSK